MDPLDKEMRIYTHRLREADKLVGVPTLSETMGALTHSMNLLREMADPTKMRDEAHAAEFNNMVGEIMMDFMNFVRVSQRVAGLDEKHVGMVEPFLKCARTFQQRMQMMERLARADGWAPEQGPISYTRLAVYRAKTQEKYP